MRTVLPLSAAEASRLACPWCGQARDRGVQGFKTVREGRTIGALVLAPAHPDRDLCPPGSTVIEALWVAPDDLGEHVGTQLVQRACGLLTTQRSRHLIAYGASGRPDCSHLPSNWLAHVGFVEHVDGVQWRIDLRRTLPVLSLLRDAAALPSRILRPRGEPQAAGRVHRGLPG